jgi:hypothetical protein
MRGLSARTKELIVFAYQLLKVSHPMTLRQLHYAIFSAAKIDYDNTQADYKRLSRATTHARRLHRARELAGYPPHLMPAETIPHDWIIDELREAEMVNVWTDAAGNMETVKRCYRRSNWQDQPNYCEVWSEKATVLGSLRSVTQELGVMLRACRGFGSTGMERGMEEARAAASSARGGHHSSRRGAGLENYRWALISGRDRRALGEHHRVHRMTYVRGVMEGQMSAQSLREAATMLGAFASVGADWFDVIPTLLEVTPGRKVCVDFRGARPRAEVEANLPYLVESCSRFRHNLIIRRRIWGRGRERQKRGGFQILFDRGVVGLGSRGERCASRERFAVEISPARLRLGFKSC